MALREWLLQGSPKVLGAALATSVTAGLGLGLWLQLPDYLAQPVQRSEPQMIHREDPGREKWRQVVASLGGLGATFVIPSNLHTEPQPAVFETEGDRQFEMVMAEAESLIAEADAREAERDWQRQEARREQREWRMRRLADAPYGYGPPRADPYGYGPPPAYGPPPVYGPSPRYDDGPRYDEPGYDPIARHGPEPEAFEHRFDEPVPPPPPRPSYGW